MRIALLDNDRKQAGLICRILNDAGHTCDAHANSAALLAHLSQQNAELLIVDARLADAAVREKAAHALPTLFMIDHAIEDNVIAALGAGLADYIVKPVRRGELAIRVRVLLMRAYPERHTSEPIFFGEYSFDTQVRRATIAGCPIDLTQKEFELALLFFRNLNRPLSRAYILESVWSRDADIPSRTVDTHVSRVRSKLGLRPERGFRLVPVYSYGYRLEQLTA